MSLSNFKWHESNSILWGLESSLITTALMFIISLGNSMEQATPIPSIKIKHSWLSGLLKLHQTVLFYAEYVTVTPLAFKASPSLDSEKALEIFYTFFFF